MSKINDAAQVQLIAAVGWFGSMEPPLGTELSGEVGLSAQFEGYRGNTPVPYSGTERKKHAALVLAVHRKSPKLKYSTIHLSMFKQFSDIYQWKLATSRPVQHVNWFNDVQRSSLS